MSQRSANGCEAIPPHAFVVEESRQAGGQAGSHAEKQACRQTGIRSHFGTEQDKDCTPPCPATNMAMDSPEFNDDEMSNIYPTTRWTTLEEGEYEGWHTTGVRFTGTWFDRGWGFSVTRVWSKTDDAMLQFHQYILIQPTVSHDPKDIHIDEQLSVSIKWRPRWTEERGEAEEDRPEVPDEPKEEDAVYTAPSECMTIAMPMPSSMATVHSPTHMPMSKKSRICVLPNF